MIGLPKVSPFSTHSHSPRSRYRSDCMRQEAAGGRSGLASSRRSEAEGWEGHLHCDNLADNEGGVKGRGAPHTQPNVRHRRARAPGAVEQAPASAPVLLAPPSFVAKILAGIPHPLLKRGGYPLALYILSVPTTRPNSSLVVSLGLMNPLIGK